MPIPFILAGVAIGAAVFGVKKGVDAKKGYDKAANISGQAKNRFSSAKNSLNGARRKSKSRLESLGRSRFKAYEGEIRRFVTAFERIKNVELSELAKGDPLHQTSIPSFNPSDIDFKALDAMKAVIAGGGAGAAAGFLSMGAVGTFAAASTGTAISGLAGAAATNATLAWFGGGSLAAGGLGMTGGAVVLGGIVAGPVLLVGGFVLDAHAKSKVEEARATLAEATRAAAEMNRAKTLADAIGDRAHQLNQITKRLVLAYKPLLNDMESLIERETDYRRYSQQEREHLMVTVATAKTLRHLLDVPVFNKNGQVSPASGKAVKYAEERLDALAA